MLRCHGLRAVVVAENAIGDKRTDTEPEAESANLVTIAGCETSTMDMTSLGEKT